MTETAQALRWGIIGCGDVVSRKAAGGLLAAGQQITAALRRDPDALRAFGARFQVPLLTHDLAQLLASPAVDMVYIATPPHLHLEFAEQAAAAGKGVLVEKPAGRCAAETRAIAAACAAAGVPCFASYYRRHLPRARHVQQLLASGAIGALLAVEYRLQKPDSAGGWRQQPASAGGGAAWDLGGHVLDQLAAWLGPLAPVAGQAYNLQPGHDAEDLLQLEFTATAPDGRSIPGRAQWHFAAAEKRDELLLTGSRGQIRCPGLGLGGTVELVQDRQLRATGKGSVLTRLRKRLHNRFAGTRITRSRFPRPVESHQPLFAAIAASLADPAGAAGAAGAAAGADGANGIDQQLTAAVQVAAVLDAGLAGYYGSRAVGWWRQPERWQGQRLQAARALAASEAPVSASQRAQFASQGWAGPFPSGVPGLAALQVPAKERKDLHLRDPQVFATCSHPGITAVVAALLDTRALSIFKTRLHTKVADTANKAPKHAVVPWHQDVGAGNGGYHSDGRPVATWTVWLALDDVGPDGGPLCVLPGSHTRLYGDYQRNFHAQLVERGDLATEDLDRAVPLTMRRGEFVVFHSWLLHGSQGNTSNARRAGLNIRFVRNADVDADDQVAAGHTLLSLELPASRAPELAPVARDSNR